MEQSKALVVSTPTKISKLRVALNQLDNLDTTYKTKNGYMPYESNGQKTFSIWSAKSKGGLLAMLAKVYLSKQAYEKVAEITGVREYPIFKWGGETFEAWANDVKVRLSILEAEPTRKALKLKLDQYNALLSSQDRMEILDGELQELLVGFDLED